MRRIAAWGRKKSPWVMHMLCGGCNGYVITIAACLTPKPFLRRNR